MWAFKGDPRQWNSRGDYAAGRDGHYLAGQYPGKPLRMAFRER